MRIYKSFTAEELFQEPEQQADNIYTTLVDLFVDENIMKGFIVPDNFEVEIVSATGTQNMLAGQYVNQSYQNVAAGKVNGHTLISLDEVSTAFDMPWFEDLTEFPYEEKYQKLWQESDDILRKKLEKLAESTIDKANFDLMTYFANKYNSETTEEALKDLDKTILNKIVEQANTKGMSKYELLGLPLKEFRSMFSSELSEPTTREYYNSLPVKEKEVIFSRYGSGKLNNMLTNLSTEDFQQALHITPTDVKAISLIERFYPKIIQDYLNKTIGNLVNLDYADIKLPKQLTDIFGDLNPEDQPESTDNVTCVSDITKTKIADMSIAESMFTHVLNFITPEYYAELPRQYSKERSIADYVSCVVENYLVDLGGDLDQYRNMLGVWFNTGSNTNLGYAMRLIEADDSGREKEEYKIADVKNNMDVYSEVILLKKQHAKTYRLMKKLHKEFFKALYPEGLFVFRAVHSKDFKDSLDLAYNAEFVFSSLSNFDITLEKSYNVENPAVILQKHVTSIDITFISHLGIKNTYMLKLPEEELTILADRKATSVLEVVVSMKDTPTIHSIDVSDASLIKPVLNIT